MKKPIIVELTAQEMRAIGTALFVAQTGSAADRFWIDEYGALWATIQKKLRAILYERGNYGQVSATLKAKWTPEKRAEASRRAKEQHARRKREANEEMYSRP